MLFTPVLRENVMDVYILTEEDCVVEFLARTEILSSFFHQESVDAFVSCREAYAHGLQSVGSERCLVHR